MMKIWSLQVCYIYLSQGNDWILMMPHPISYGRLVLKVPTPQDNISSLLNGYHAQILY